MGKFSFDADSKCLQSFKKAERLSGEQAERPSGEQAERPSGEQAERPSGEQHVSMQRKQKRSSVSSSLPNRRPTALKMS